MSISLSNRQTIEVLQVMSATRYYVLVQNDMEVRPFTCYCEHSLQTGRFYEVTFTTGSNGIEATQVSSLP